MDKDMILTDTPIHQEIHSHRKGKDAILVTNPGRFRKIIQYLGDPEELKSDPAPLKTNWRKSPPSSMKKTGGKMRRKKSRKMRRKKSRKMRRKKSRKMKKSRK